MIVKGSELEAIKSPKPQSEILVPRDEIAIDYFGTKISYRELYSMVKSVSSQLEIKKEIS